MLVNQKDFVYALGACTTSSGCTNTLDICGDVVVVRCIPVNCVTILP